MKTINTENRNCDKNISKTIRKIKNTEKGKRRLQKYSYANK